MRGAPAPYPLTPSGRLCVLLALAKLALLVPILGRPIVWCRLRAPLGQVWAGTFATARL